MSSSVHNRFTEPSFRKVESTEGVGVKAAEVVKMEERGSGES